MDTTTLKALRVVTNVAATDYMKMQDEKYWAKFLMYRKERRYSCELEKDILIQKNHFLNLLETILTFFDNGDMSFTDELNVELREAGYLAYDGYAETLLYSCLHPPQEEEEEEEEEEADDEEED